MAKIDIPFLAKTAKRPYPLPGAVRTCIAHIREYPGTIVWRIDLLLIQITVRDQIVYMLSARRKLYTIMTVRYHSLRHAFVSFGRPFLSYQLEFFIWPLVLIPISSEVACNLSIMFVLKLFSDHWVFILLYVTRWFMAVGGTFNRDLQAISSSLTGFIFDNCLYPAENSRYVWEGTRNFSQMTLQWKMLTLILPW